MGVASGNEGAICFQMNDRQRKCFGMQQDLVAVLEVLKLRNDSLGIVQIAPAQVFKPGITLEAAFVLTDLHNPFPDFGLWGMDRDCVCCPLFGSWREFIAR